MIQTTDDLNKWAATALEKNDPYTELNQGVYINATTFKNILTGQDQGKILLDRTEMKVSFYDLGNNLYLAKVPINEDSLAALQTNRIERLIQAKLTREKHNIPSNDPSSTKSESKATTSDKSYALYLLVFPDKNVFKVGKSSSVNDRIKHFDWIGKPDLDASFQLISTENRIGEIEKGIHKLLSYARADIGDGDGHTELFELSALDKAVNLVEISIHGQKKLSLKKGITLPPKTTKKGRTYLRGAAYKQRQFINRLKKPNYIENAEKLHWLIKACGIFIQRAHRIPYQYSIDDQHILFQLDSDYEIKYKILHTLFYSGKTSFDENNMSDRHTMANLLPGLISNGGIHQIDINYRFMPHLDNNPYFFNEAISIIKKTLESVPTKSVCTKHTGIEKIYPFNP